MLEFNVETMNDFPELKEWLSQPEQKLFSEIGEWNSDIKNYGVEQCSCITKNIFTPELVNEDWKALSPEERQAVLEGYGEELADALGIDYKGMVFTSLCDETMRWGCSEGKGTIFLSRSLIEEPETVIHAVDTVAHEMRHEFQTQALQNPEKFGLDEKTQKEWTVAEEMYKNINIFGSDPYGYQFNPLELDARGFSEAIVRNLESQLLC